MIIANRKRTQLCFGKYGFNFCTPVLTELFSKSFRLKIKQNYRSSAYTGLCLKGISRSITSVWQILDILNEFNNNIYDLGVIRKILKCAKKVEYLTFFSWCTQWKELCFNSIV